MTFYSKYGIMPFVEKCRKKIMKGRIMMRIAICDSDIKCAEKTKNMIYDYANKRRLELLVEIYDSSEALLESENNYLLQDKKYHVFQNKKHHRRFLPKGGGAKDCKERNRQAPQKKAFFRAALKEKSAALL